MKKIFSLLAIIAALTFSSCSDDNDDNITLNTEAQTTFSFKHTWNDTEVTSADFNTIQYTNENGEMLSIERLRYVISDITFSRDGQDDIVFDMHNLVDVTNNNNTTLSLDENIPTGVYTNVSFTFGLDNEDNTENYIDLNTENFNVPEMLGGGYHYMQFDGKFINSSDAEQGFNYHAIRAVDNPGMNPTFPQDTFFEVNLGAVTITNDATFQVQMNIAEWFKSPNLWDLNQYNQMLMPNSTAQIMMYENGASVFSLESVTQ
ncbi:MbnP family protein [Lacinutrix sp. 5H-3-7-4]|uniref:MbnP family protein n=1 Tax=Lacinutrix sp. (strain 5H-3-7-4) TaxID=983544 RepID=UPI00020A3C04|nr:MbnP family protein [Lacinutrix sp. 5H-3-7-4]AEH01031.1 hypothetical protein Lacal_1183 [Lacinutrix sp. 5H-3-7-4]